MIGIEIVRDQRTKEEATDLRNADSRRSPSTKRLLIPERRRQHRPPLPPLLIDEQQADFALETLSNLHPRCRNQSLHPVGQPLWLSTRSGRASVRDRNSQRQAPLSF